MKTKINPKVQRLLDKFWVKVDRPLNKGERTSERRLKLLKKYAAVIVHRPSSETRMKRRTRFRRSHRRDSGRCWCCADFAGIRERHHIIQLQYGGPNHHRNIVTICQSCHDRVHPWLVGSALPELHEAAHKPIWA